MRNHRQLFILSVFSLIISSLPFHAYSQNPVLKGVADAGCVKYGGKYYLGGVATYGDFFVSDDLLHWDNRIHVFDLDNDWTHGTGAKNNQVHADDISYSGGLFHLLFSVNYWGSDRHIVHITHATSSNIEGPYKEVREDQWYENRIDPQVFQDEDGCLYLYMVKFTDGNTIWARPLNDDFSFAGDAVQQFSSQPGTWETLDNRVAEGPFVIKYRGRYYMMYNANHTAPEFGNYHLGVCEAPSPLMFNPGGKYSHPVVGPNTEPIAEHYTDLLRYGGKGYNAINLTDDENHFTLDAVPQGNVYMLLAQRGGAVVFVNGQQVNTGDRAEYAYYKIENDKLKAGDNIIKVLHPAGGRKADISHLYLYDMGDNTPDEVLVTPGQPNILRGPNGWEWWLVYMANQGWQRHQFIDRVHFVNDRMTVDGITGADTPGFHPAPALPQYAGTSLDALPEADAYLLEITSKRNGIPEEWRIEKNYDVLTVWKNKTLIIDHKTIDGVANVENIINEARGDELVYVSFCEGFDEYDNHFSGWTGAAQTSRGLVLNGQATLFKPAATADYSFSACFKTESDKGEYGVYAAYVDKKNYVSVTIDAERQMLITENVIKGKHNRTEQPMGYTDVHYPDIKYTDSYEKQYRFDCDTWVDAVEYPHLDASHDGYASSLSISQGQQLYREDMAGMMTLEYLDIVTDKWIPINYVIAESDHKAWQRVVFPRVKTRALRMINKDPRQNDRNIYKVKTSRAFELSNQLRIEKRGADIHIFLGQREMNTVCLKESIPSRPAIIADAKSDVIVSNTLYYVVK